MDDRTRAVLLRVAGFLKLAADPRFTVTRTEAKELFGEVAPLLGADAPLEWWQKCINCGMYVPDRGYCSSRCMSERQAKDALSGPLCGCGMRPDGGMDYTCSEHR
jgi:hypothetical protein